MIQSNATVKLAGLTLAAFALTLGPPATARAQQPAAEAFQGALIIDTTNAPYRDPIRLGRLVNELKRWPFDSVIVKVRAWGDAYYDSELAPRALGVSENYDPLGEMIEALGALDPPIGVYAWVVLYRAANVNRAVPAARNHVAQLYPNWLSRNSSFLTEDEGGNQYLEPGLPAVQAHMEAIVAELAGKYPLEGIVLDGAQYPGLDSDWGYHPDVLELWRRQTGQLTQPRPDDPSWRMMRRQIIGNSVRGLGRVAKAIRPDLIVAAFARTDGPAPVTAADFSRGVTASGALQDWPAWMRDRSVDRIFMLNERSQGTQPEDFAAWTRFAATQVAATGVEVLPVIGGSVNISIDALEQMRDVQRAGLLGVALRDYRTPLLDLGARELFFRTLDRTVLGPSSTRMALPDAPLPEPLEPAELPPPPVAETPMPQATPAPAPERSELDRLLQGAQGPRPGPLMIQPPGSALAYLRGMFPNIFK